MTLSVSGVDLPNGVGHSSQATPTAADKSSSASNAKIRTARPLLFRCQIDYDFLGTQIVLALKK